MNKLADRMRALGSRRSASKAAAARTNGLKGGRPITVKIGARVEIKHLKLGLGLRRVYVTSPNEHAGRVARVIEIATHDITYRTERYVKQWTLRRGRWQECKLARDDERTIECRDAVHVRFDDGSEAWVPRYQVRLRR